MTGRVLLVDGDEAVHTALLREGCFVRRLALAPRAGVVALWSARRSLEGFVPDRVLAPADHIAAIALAERLGVPCAAPPADGAWLAPPLPLDGFLAEAPSPLLLEAPAEWPSIAPDAVSRADDRHLAAALRAGCAVAGYARAEALGVYAERHAAALAALRRAAGLEDVVTS